MNFDEYDKIDDFELNEILWRSIKGKDAPIPPAVRRAIAYRPKRPGEGRLDKAHPPCDRAHLFPPRSGSHKSARGICPENSSGANSGSVTTGWAPARADRPQEGPHDLGQEPGRKSQCIQSSLAV